MSLQLAKCQIYNFRIQKKNEHWIINVAFVCKLCRILQVYALTTILARFGFRVILITHKMSLTFKSLLKGSRSTYL